MEYPGGVTPDDAAPTPAVATGKPATIYDVARVAGVSPSTVSRALSKPGRISAPTERRIREAAASLDYRLNPMARALPTGRTSTLGVLLSDITNPVYFDLLRGAGSAASAHGYTLVMAESQDSAEQEQEAAGRLLPAVDGLVLVSTRLDDATITQLADRKPLVLVNRHVTGVPGLVPDVRPGITAALDHLAGLGHRSIAYLAGPTTSWMNTLRREAVFAGAPERGMSVVEIGPNAPTLDGGRAALRRVRASGVTAVMTYNDLIAIGLLSEAQAGGVEVPRELSIVGFDDIFGSDFTSPPVTTIRTPLALAGRAAVNRAVAQIAGEAADASVDLTTELVLRGSTAAPA
jgi:LacI family transcriptional regulator